MSELQETRQERLERIRREIADGTYETPEKLEAALETFVQTVDRGRHRRVDPPDDSMRGGPQPEADA